MRSTFPLAAAFVVSLFVPRVATAADESPARTLYGEAVAAFKAGDVRTACAKLDESYKLEAVTQTLFALAKCRQREGRLATAYAQFQELEKRSQRENDTARASEARARLKEIEPKLSQTVMKLASHPEVSEVKIDGRSIPRTEWAAPILLDAGAHTFVFSGPGKVDLVKSIYVQEGDILTFEINPLMDVDAFLPPAPPQSSPAPSASSSEASASASTDGGSNKTLGYILGGAGIASIAFGSVMGVVAIGHKSDADDLFARRDPSFKDADDAASTTALVSTITIGVGVALVGAGAYFLFFSGDSKKATGAVHLRNGAIAF
jgi:hypothetical protein